MGAQIKRPVKRLGVWSVKAVNTVYQAATDGFAIAELDSVNDLNGLTDSANPPVTLRTNNSDSDGASNPAGVTLPVRKGDYWEITSGGAPNVYWIPLEP